MPKNIIPPVTFSFTAEKDGVIDVKALYQYNDGTTSPQSNIESYEHVAWWADYIHVESITPSHPPEIRGSRYVGPHRVSFKLNEADTKRNDVSGFNLYRRNPDGSNAFLGSIPYSEIASTTWAADKRYDFLDVLIDLSVIQRTITLVIVPVNKEGAVEELDKAKEATFTIAAFGDKDAVHLAAPIDLKDASTGVTIDIPFSLDPGNERAASDIAAFVLEYKKSTDVTWSELKTVTGNERVFDDCLVPGTSGDTVNFRATMRYKAGDDSLPASASITHFMLPTMGLSDKFYIDDARFHVSISTSGTAPPVVQFIFRVKQDPDNERRKEEVTSFEVYVYSTVSEKWTLHKTLTGTYASDFVFDLPRSYGPEFRIFINPIYDDAIKPVVTTTNLGVGDYHRWIDTNFGVGDGCEVTSLKKVARTANKDGDVLEIYFQRLAGSYRTDIAKYHLFVDYRNGRGFIDSSLTLTDASLPFSFATLDIEGPAWGFLVIPEYESGDVGLILDPPSTLSYIYQDYGKNDKVIVEGIKEGDAAADRVVPIEVTFSVPTSNHRNGQISGITVIQAADEQLTKNKKSTVFTYLPDQETGFNSIISPNKIVIQHDPRENRLGKTEYFKIILNYRKPASWDALYPDFPFTLESLLTVASLESFTYANFGKKDFAEFVGEVIATDSGGPPYVSSTYTVDIQGNLLNERHGIRSYELLHKTSDGRFESLGTSPTTPFKVKAVDKLYPSRILYPGLIYYDNSFTDPELASSITIPTPNYGLHDFATITNIGNVTESIASDGRPSLSFRATFSISSLNDLSAADITSVKLSSSDFVVSGAFTIDAVALTGTIEGEVIQEDGPDYALKLILIYGTSGISALAGPAFAYTFSDYGTNDRTNILSIDEDGYREDTTGKYVRLHIKFADDPSNDRKGAIEHLLYAKIGISGTFALVSRVAASSDTAVYLAYYKDSPIWAFKVVPAFSTDPNDRGSLAAAPERSYTNWDPGAEDKVTITSASILSAALVSGVRTYTLGVKFSYSAVRRQVGDIALFRLYSSYDGGEYEPVADSTVLSATTGEAGVYLIEMPYTENEIGPRELKVVAQFEPSAGGGTTRLSQTDAFHYYYPDPDNNDYVTLRANYVSSAGTNDSINIDVLWDNVGRLRSSVKTVSLYHSISPNSGYTKIAEKNGDVKRFLAISVSRREAEEHYYYGLVSFEDGRTTSADVAPVVTYTISNYGATDKAYITDIVAGAVGEDHKGYYTLLTINFSVDNNNDRTNDLISGFDLKRTGNNDVIVSTQDAKARSIQYKAYHKEGPTYTLYIDVIYSIGPKVTTPNQSWTYSLYGVTDNFVTYAPKKIGSWSEAGKEGYKLQISGKPNEYNDRQNVTAYHLYLASDSLGNYKKVSTYSVTETTLTGDGVVNFIYQALDTAGPIYCFKVLIEFAGSGPATKLENANYACYEEAAHGYDDIAQIDGFTVGAPVTIPSVGTAVPITLVFSLHPNNDRTDQTGYRLEHRTELTEWAEVKESAASEGKSFVYNSPLSEAGTHYFRVIILYDHGAITSRADITPVFTVSLEDPEDTDVVTILSAKRLRHFTDGDSSGNWIQLNFEPKSTNNRTDIVSFSAYQRDDENDVYVLAGIVEGKNARNIEVKVFSDEPASVQFAIIANFESGTSTNLAKAPFFVYDNSDPDDVDRATITKVVDNGRSTSHISAQNVQIFYKPDLNNTVGADQIAAYTLWVANSGKASIGDYVKAKTSYTAAPFSFDAIDGEGPWNFIVQIQFASGRQSSLRTKDAYHFALVDPQKTDVITITAISEEPEVVDSRLGRYRQIVINFIEGASNNRKSPVSYKLYKSLDGETYSPLNIDAVGSAFYYTVYAVNEADLYFKVTGTYADMSSTLLDITKSFRYQYPGWGENDAIQIIQVSPGGALPGGLNLHISTQALSSNDRSDISGYTLMALDSLHSEYVPIQTIANVNLGFVYPLIFSEGPNYKFWIRINYTDNSVSVIQPNYVYSYQDNTRDHAEITTFIQGSVSVVNGARGRKLYVVYRPNEANVRKSTSIKSYHLQLRDNTGAWQAVLQATDPDLPFDAWVAETLGPAYEFRVLIEFNDGTYSRESATPTRVYTNPIAGWETDNVLATQPILISPVVVDNQEGGRYKIEFKWNDANIRSSDDVLIYTLYKGTSLANMQAVDYKSASPFEFTLTHNEGPDFYFKVQIVFKNADSSSLNDMPLIHAHIENPGTEGGGDTPSVTPVYTTRMTTLGLVYGGVLIETSDITSVTEDITGFENLRRQWQAEYNFVVTLKGYAWNKEAKRSPQEADLSNKDNWSQYVTSRKDTFGVMLVTN